MEGCLLSLFFSGEKKSGKKQREKKSLTKGINKRNGGAVPFVMVLQFSRASVQYSAPYISVSRKVERAFSCAMLTLVMVSSPSTVI